MSNQFFIWKNPNCKGINPEWIELSGEEFLKFIRKPENSQRKFIKEYVDDEYPQLGYFKFEVNEDKYKEWRATEKRKERCEDVTNANNQKAKLSLRDDIDEKQYINIPTVVSFDMAISEEEDLTLHDVITDRNNEFDKVDKTLQIKMLYAISRSFSKQERNILEWLYFNNPEDKNETEIAKEHNLSQQYINKMKKKIIKKLQKVGC